MSEKLLFVSHASADADLAKALVHAVERAFNISARQILCSSVEGYRLEGGARTSDTLRAVIATAPAFAAILTPQSIVSSYVLFELGARWGVGKQISPLLARGATADVVPGPLKELNVLDLAELDQSFQFIDELKAVLGLPHEPFSAFRSAVNDLSISAASVTAPPSGGKPAVAGLGDNALPNDIRQIALKKMRKALASTPWEYVRVLSQKAGISAKDAEDYLRFEPDVIFAGSGSDMRASLQK